MTWGEMFFSRWEMLTMIQGFSVGRDDDTTQRNFYRWVFSHAPRGLRLIETYDMSDICLVPYFPDTRKPCFMPFLPIDGITHVFHVVLPLPSVFFLLRAICLSIERNRLMPYPSIVRGIPCLMIFLREKGPMPHCSILDRQHMFVSCLVFRYRTR